VTDETEVTCTARGDAESRWLKRGKVKRKGKAGTNAARADDEPYDEFEDDEYEYDDEYGDEEELQDELDEDAGEHDPGNGTSSSCRLKTGTKVREAELAAGPEGPVFVRIELVR
jgi:hypothetical protein